VTEDQQEMKELTREFYENLYTSEGRGMEEVLSHVPVTLDMNAKLLAPFQNKEIKEALFQIYPTKAPGPDGFPAHFFRRHWELCGEEVTRAVFKGSPW
jgi:hypothetical protein